MANDYKIEANTKFVENVTIESLDENVAVFLNDYDETQVTNFLTQVGTKLLQINKAQMEKLGLKEYENPLLYSNPITSLLIYGFSTEPVVDSTNSENESIDNIEESDGESNIVTQENE